MTAHGRRFGGGRCPRLAQPQQRGNVARRPPPGRRAQDGRLGGRGPRRCPCRPQVAPIDFDRPGRRWHRGARGQGPCPRLADAVLARLEPGQAPAAVRSGRIRGGPAPRRNGRRRIGRPLGVLERQRALAGSTGKDWVTDAWRAVFLDGTAWQAALRRQSPERLEAGAGGVEQVAGPGAASVVGREVGGMRGPAYAGVAHRLTVRSRRAWRRTSHSRTTTTIGRGSGLRRASKASTSWPHVAVTSGPPPAPSAVRR
jgi:hypothetical protein